MGVEIEAIQEHALTERDMTALAGLLEDCFPDTFRGGSYVKQLPHSRLLARDGDRLVGQVGLDFRVIRVGSAILNVFGVIDLCVTPASRRRRTGVGLLKKAERIAVGSSAEFMILMADRHEIYLSNGYVNIRPARTRWLAIEDRSSVKVIERDLGDCFMAKPIAGKPWPGGSVDMLGYLF